jgi:predicted aconitase
VRLTSEEQEMLEGKQGRSVRKAMEILAALGTIYEAEAMLPVASVQVAGVSYDNLGEAGLEWLDDMAQGGGQARVLTTLNPAGMDLDNWQVLGIDPEFARQQERVIQAFGRMGVVTNCSCTPYLSGSLPHYGEHIAWAESSAVCYANSVLGARTNREGGPSALAAALTGRTPAYGYHLDENRRPGLTVEVQTPLSETYQFGAMGYVIGKYIEANKMRPVPYIRGIDAASLEGLKSFCASLATYGGAALFHMPGITPEAALYNPPADTLTVTQADLLQAGAAMSEAAAGEIDFASLGCPHLSIAEIARLAALLRGQQVKKEFWITTSRPVKHLSDRMGYTHTIEEAGALFAVDTCCVVAPIKGRFTGMATDSAKACYYASSKNKFKTLYLPFEDVVKEALR